MPEVDDPFRSLANTGGQLNISPRSVIREIDRGKLPAHKFGGLVRIRQSDIDAYIERSRRGEVAPAEPEPNVTPRRRSRRTRSREVAA
jgi:excisionase family DNA binding protein